MVPQIVHQWDDRAPRRFTGQCNVFDFDGALFQDLWKDPQRTPSQFRGYVRYHISDHRPLWAEFATA